jgi:hypothetical protein
MDEYLARLFGSQPSYMGQLMGADDAERLRQEAQRQGLLGTGIGLLMASGPSAQRQNIGQIVGQGLMAGQQAYRGAMQQAVQDKMMGLQLSEMAKKQRAEQALPGLIEGAMVAPQREFTDLERMEMRTPSVATGPAQFNPQQFLQRAAAVGVSPSVAIPLGQQIQSFTTPKTVKLGAGEALVEESTGREVAARAKPAEYKTFTTDAGTFAYDVNNPTASFKIADAAGETYTGDAATVAKSLYGSAKVPPTQEQRNAILKGTIELKSSSSTKLVMPGEKLTNKTMEKFGEQYPSMLTQAVSADQTNQRLASIIENKNQKMYTGLLAPGQIAAAQFLQSFGVQVDPEKLANTRTSQATANQLTLDFMGAMGGAKGFSKEESAILYDSFPKIVDDPNSRARIAEMLIKRNNQIIDDFNSIRSSLEEYEGGRPLPGRKISPFDLSKIKQEEATEKKKPSNIPSGVRVTRMP